MLCVFSFTPRQPRSLFISDVIASCEEICSLVKQRWYLLHLHSRTNPDNAALHHSRAYSDMAYEFTACTDSQTDSRTFLQASIGCLWSGDTINRQLQPGLEKVYKATASIGKNSDCVQLRNQAKVPLTSTLFCDYLSTRSKNVPSKCIVCCCWKRAPSNVALFSFSGAMLIWNSFNQALRNSFLKLPSFSFAE